MSESSYETQVNHREEEREVISDKEDRGEYLNRLDSVANNVLEKFNITDEENEFQVFKFDDKRKDITIGFQNEQYSVIVKIKHPQEVLGDLYGDEE